jgi:hypothetical protein
MLGKQKCRILKEIRQRIADENDIPYVTRECSFQGACKGTCPRCESELRYLEQQLALRRSLGKRVAVTALCATMALAAASCGPEKDGGVPEELGGMAEPYETPEPLEGEIACETPGPDEPLAGEPEPEEFELEGDVAWIPEDEAAPENGNG